MDKLRVALEEMIRAEVSRQVAAALEARGPTPLVMPAVLSVADAAVYCGISRKTLYNLKSAGRGPTAYKRGRTTAYFRADLDEWLRSTLKRVK